MKVLREEQENIILIIQCGYCGRIFEMTVPKKIFEDTTKEYLLHQNCPDCRNNLIIHAKWEPSKELK